MAQLHHHERPTSANCTTVENEQSELHVARGQPKIPQHRKNCEVII
jgi:hypothetical protein